METKLSTYGYVESSSQEQKQHPAEEAATMKKCPFCAEQIQSEAVKCRYCGEFLEGFSRGGSRPKQKKWYFATTSVVIALLCLGPLALPLVWFNPRYKPTTRVVITVVVLVVTILCMYLVTYVYQQLLNQFTSMGM